MAIHYQDDCVTCDDDGISIRFYYFPAGDKRIHYTDIERATERTMTLFSGRGRIWGSSDFKHWYHLDSKRPNKTKCLVLEVGSWFRPVITPDDVDRVRAILEERGVRVTSA